MSESSSNTVYCEATPISKSKNSSSKERTAYLSQQVAPDERIVYHSTQEKTKELANAYAKTDQLSHRYLAYRDLPNLMRQHLRGKKALDYGTGTGISAAFLHNRGLDVIGVDINPLMLEKAQESFSHIQFLEIKNLGKKIKFDLIFSSFVLFDMQSKMEIIEYIVKGTSFMKKNGVFIAITGSEELYSVSRNWISYDSKFEENRSLKSGDIAKLRLKHPPIEFSDYFWTETDYIDCFQKAGLEVLSIHKPIGLENDPYLWEDEKLYPPFKIYILKKKVSN